MQGATKVAGVESELAAQLTEDDRVNVVLSWILNKELGTLLYAGSNDYGGLPPCPPESGIGSCLDVSGNELAHAPDASVTLIYEHAFVLSNGAKLTPRISGHYETSSWLSLFNLGEGDKQKAYGRSDLSVRYVPPDAKWWAGAYVDNVSDVKCAPTQDAPRSAAASSSTPRNTSRRARSASISVSISDRVHGRAFAPGRRVRPRCCRTRRRLRCAVRRIRKIDSCSVVMHCAWPPA